MLSFYGKAIIGSAWELLKLFPNLIVMIILAQLLRFFLPSWLLALGVGWIFATILPIIGACYDLKNNIVKDGFSAAFQAISTHFSDKDGGADGT